MAYESPEQRAIRQNITRRYRSVPEDAHLQAIERRLKRRRKFQVKKKQLPTSFFREKMGPELV